MKHATLEAITLRKTSTIATGTMPLYSHVVIGEGKFTQPLNSPRQPAGQPTPLNGTAQSIEPRQPREKDGINEGWTYVTRRKARRGKPERRDHPKLNKQMELLKAQGRCYRCLDRGHTKFQCRNSVRCIKCHGYDHISKRCTTRTNPTINKPLTSNTSTKENPTSSNSETPKVTQPPPIMDYENWETMPMLSPDLLQVRAPELRVFFLPNDNMNPQNHRKIGPAIPQILRPVNDRPCGSTDLSGRSIIDSRAASQNGSVGGDHSTRADDNGDIQLSA